MKYDVFVVGAKDPSPVAQMHLSAKLAEHFHAPAVQIAQAIASRNLRAGQALDEAQARILTNQLATLGAETELRPVVGDRRNTGVHPTTQVTGAPTMAGGPTMGAGGPTMGAGGPTAVSSPPGTMAAPVPGTPVGAPTVAGAPPTMAASPPTMGAGPGQYTQAGGGPTMAGDVVGRDPFAPPDAQPAPGTAVSGAPTSMMTGPPSSMTRAAPGPGGAPGGADSFAPPTGDLPKLELVPRGPQKPGDSQEAPKPQQPSFGHDAGGAPSKLAADSAESGVALTDGKTHMVRCSKHGLYFDKRSASGCRKCLEPARERAAAMGGKKGAPSVVSKAMRLRDNPVKHAFIGLALALFIGLLPAAFHALTMGAPEVAKLRAEQTELSKQVGTKKVIDRFAQLDKQVRDKHNANFRLSGLIWLGAGGLVLVGWHKLT